MRDTMITITSLLIFSQLTEKVEASASFFNPESEERKALTQPFTIEMKFKVERGVFTIFINNRECDETTNYIRPYLFENMTAFWGNAHALMLKAMEQGIADLEPDYIADGYQGKESNVIFPLKYQVEALHHYEFFQMPESLLYVGWQFKPNTDNESYGDLRMFSSLQQYHGYVQNMFAEKLYDLQHEASTKRAKKAASTLYL